MPDHKITGRERVEDAAEKWLRENDPDYKHRKRGWQSPSTDALARDRDEHVTLRHKSALRPGHDDGGYRSYPKTASTNLPRAKFENLVAVPDPNETE